MKAISLWQPWASLLVSGHKRVETRSWASPYLGPLLIHAAQKWNGELAMIARHHPDFKAALESMRVLWTPAGNRKLRRPTLPFGAIIGRVDLVDCVRTHLVAAKGKPGSEPGFYEGWLDGVLGRHLIINSTEREFGDYSPGRFAWLCKNPVLFPEPIPYPGARLLFDVPESELEPASAG